MSTGDAIDLGIGVTLAVTMLGVFWYAREARRQANASSEIAKEMLRTRHDAVRPVLNINGELPSDLRAHLTDTARENPPTHAEATLRNVGTGPALDTKLFFFVHEETSELEVGAIEIDGLFPGERRPDRNPITVLYMAVTEDDEIGRKISVTYRDVYGNRLESLRPVNYDEAVAGWVLGELVTRRVGA